MNLKIFILVFILIIFIPQPVAAYLDPGMASLLWQMIVALSFGVVFSLKMYWQKFKNLFQKNKSNDPEE